MSTQSASANACPNPGFELLDPAGDNFPLYWTSEVVGSGNAIVRIDPDAHGGAVAALLTSAGDGLALLRSEAIDVRKGALSFYGKRRGDSAEGTLRVVVVGVDANGDVVERRGPAALEEAADGGSWREGSLAFDFLSRREVAAIMIEVCVEHGGEWVVDDFGVEEQVGGPRMVIEALHLDDTVLRPGAATKLTVQLANQGDAALPASVFQLELPQGVKADGEHPASLTVPELMPRDWLRFSWHTMFPREGEYDVAAVWKADGAGGEAHADGQQPGNGAVAYANDGDESTYWYAGEERADGKLWIDFHEPQEVHMIQFLGWATPRHAPADYTVGVIDSDGVRKEVARVRDEKRMGEFIAFPCSIPGARGIWLDVDTTVEGRYGPVVYEFQAFRAAEGGALRLVSGAGTGQVKRTAHVVCQAGDDQRAVCRRSDGYWRMMPAARPLQRGNDAPLLPLSAARSADLPDSCIGITAHLPRTRDFEVIFEPEHLIDGDPATSWSGRAHATPVPGGVDWAEIHLGATADIEQIRLWPYWKAEGFPIDFTIYVQADGAWHPVHEARGIHLDSAAGEGAKTPYVVRLNEPVAADAVRLEATRFRTAAPFFTDCAPTNYLRLSGIDVVDTGGQNRALADLGATVDVSWTFRSYFNSREVIEATYPELYNLGVKWNRVGQWGDWTCWAIVEQEKGVYYLDPSTDQAITESIENGVDILFTLDYGNPVYEETPWLTDPGPVWRHGHPFTGDGGPTTPEAIAGFVAYARFIARELQGRVTHYEIWNEENSWAWYGSPPDPKAFGTLIRETAKAVKEVDLRNKVIIGGTAALAPVFIAQALEEGGGKYLDGFAFHPYTMPYPEMGLGSLDVIDGTQQGKTKEELGYTTYAEMLQFLRDTFAPYNPDFEIWANEWNAIPTSEDSPYRGGSEITEAKQAARFFLVNTLHEVKAVWWSLANQNTVYDWGVLRTEDLSRKPIYYTIQAMSTLLSGATADASVRAALAGDTKDVWCKTLRGRDGGLLAAVWSATSPVDDFPPRTVDLALQGVQAESVDAVDTLHALSQAIHFEQTEERLTVPGLCVTDCPVILRIKTRK